MKPLTIGFAVCAAVALGGTASTEVRNPPQGKALYVQFSCAACHGTVGQGGAGPRLAPDPLPLEAFAAYLRHPGGVMPPYSAEALSDADVKRIHAYLGRIAASQQVPALLSDRPPY